MATEDLKKEITDAIDNIPDNVLVDVLKYIKSLENKSKDKIQLSQNLSDILKEDRNLLERLAK